MRVIGAEELRRLVPMDRAIDAVERAFRDDDSETPPRRHLAIGDADLLFMPSWSTRAAGVKLVTVTPGNPARGLPLINGSYLLFDRETLRPSAVIDAAALTGLRTAAVSGVATRALAHPEAKALVIFGAGVQAHRHLEAMVAVRPIRELGVVSRSDPPARALVDHARSLGLDASVGTPSVSDADIVCTCTTSPSPVFDGARLNDVAHVNAVGSYKADAREIDSETVRRASVVVVEDREVMRESGDLAVPLTEGDLDETGIVTLGEVLGGAAAPRGITLFKSVGRAFEDLAVAEAAVAALD